MLVVNCANNHKQTGDNGLTEYEWRTSKTSKIKAETPNERKVSEEVKKNFKIYFPTRDTVVGCKGGIGVRWFLLMLCFRQVATFRKMLTRNLLSIGWWHHISAIEVVRIGDISEVCHAQL